LPTHAHGKRSFSLREVLAVAVIPFTLAPPAVRLVPIERTVAIDASHLATLSIAIRGPPQA